MAVIPCILYLSVLLTKPNMSAESGQTGDINSTSSLPPTLVASSALHYLFESVCFLNIVFDCMILKCREVSKFGSI